MDLVGPDPEPDGTRREGGVEIGDSQEIILLRLKVIAAEALGKLACRS